MAGQDNSNSPAPQGTTNVKTNTFNKGMVRDFSDAMVGEGMWTLARNAINVTPRGDMGVIGNEPSNQYCTSTPYTVIGMEHIEKTSWVVFSTNDAGGHEIGIFNESGCKYTKKVSGTCLNFSTKALITAAVQKNYDCTWSVVFADGVNPDRLVNLDRIPYKIQGYTGSTDCPVPVYSTDLDCDQIRLMALNDAPVLRMVRGTGSGQLPNGSYQAVIAYSVNGVRVSDYFLPSNAQSVWTHENNGGSIEIHIDVVDKRFEEYELVVVAMINGQTTARRIGIYSTRQAMVYLDNYSEALAAVQLSLIPLHAPVYDKSDRIFTLNNYLLRSGVSTRPEPNYQLLANQVVTKWVEVEYPADYYYKGGHNLSYLRDENEIFFIRWVYNTGHRTSSYPVVGRAAQPSDLAIASNTGDIVDPAKNRNWQVNNTATRNVVTPYNINWQGEPDPAGLNGRVTAEGLMGYHESTERHPSDKPQVWGTLCGKPITLHKFPDHNLSHTNNSTSDKIYVLGVKFENIQHPLDLNGNPIQDIVGYEILRGSREGNKTVIARGLVQNMRGYPLLDSPGSTRKGAYQNYPYNDLRPDNFMSKSLISDDPFTEYFRDFFSFHSPDTTFRKPFLSAAELKIHGELHGTATGNFDWPYKHPKHKLISNALFTICATMGMISSFFEALGSATTTHGVSPLDDAPAALAANAIAFTGSGAALSPAAVAGASMAAGLATAISPLQGWWGENKTGVSTGGGFGVNYNQRTGGGGLIRAITDYIPAIGEVSRRILDAALTATYAVFLGGKHVDAMVRIAKAFSKRQQYALQYNSHGLYNNFLAPRPNEIRRSVTRNQYVDPYIVDFDPQTVVHNLFRNKFVGVRVGSNIADPQTLDDSRQRMHERGSFDDPLKRFDTTISGYLASLKVNFDNQFGQLDSVVQIPVHSGVYKTQPVKGKPFISPVIFGGDQYINRYTEKTTFFYFHAWLMDLPDEIEYNYRNYINIPYPNYWADFENYDFGDMNINLSINSGITWTKPSDFHKLDGTASGNMIIRERYFYLLNSGVRDFFVESEINLAHRDRGERMEEHFYDPNGGFSDLYTMFRSDLAKIPNYYSYDYSLSASRFINNYVSWGSVLPRDYDPQVYATCFTYYPGRMLYSLQQQFEQKREAWRVFLANNYKDFEHRVNTVKPLNKTGALVLFDDAEPAVFNGVDELKTGNGVKVTIGDGGLFNQPFQSMVNADDVYEYGACQSTRSVVNCPHGTFWISQRNGKIHQMAGEGVGDISAQGLKSWFTRYLPSELLKRFPDYPYYDNPVGGVGCQAVYDNQYEILYFCKKDYKPKDNVCWDAAAKKFIPCSSGSDVIFGPVTGIALGDPMYFEDCSWTVSYDPKEKMWISYHDWYPDLVMPAADHFYTIKGSGFWKHNVAWNSFCNYYGKDHPFELEFPVSNGQTVHTLRSVEFLLECYKLENGGLDAFHILDEGFDYAAIWNTEQFSGWLKLELQPKNDPAAMLAYPKIGTTDIRILVSKEEQKYRFNQFWDIVRDRGEFTGASRQIWNTASNGYTRSMVLSSVDYNKPILERKRFRHYGSRVILRKAVSGSTKMLLRTGNVKQAISFR